MVDENKHKPRHRTTFEIDSEVHRKLQEYVPWGTMTSLINIMLKDFVQLCERYDPNLILGAILSEEITLKEYLNKYETLKDEEEDDG